MGWDKRHRLGSLEWEDVPLVVPDLKIKFLYTQVVIEKALRYQSDEHDRNELKWRKKERFQ